MALKFKQRNSRPKKVLIYGLDGTGKSTFAEEYCKKHQLNAVCIDIDDTNFTSIPCIEFERSNHLKVKNQVLTFIEDVKKSEDFDTVIIDGVSSLLNLLVSDSKGIKMYGDRTVALNKILNELARSKLNFILIGQIDLETDRDEISSAVVNINSIVNEKYLCFIEKGQYLSEAKKLRVEDDFELLEAEAKPKPKTPKKPKVTKPVKGFETAAEIEPTDEQPVLDNYMKTVAIKVIQAGDKLNKINMRKKVFELVQLGEIDSSIKEDLYKYINENCPGE